MSDRLPVILDTDIGSDIDDAVALAYLLRQPRCELVGVTTVTGDVNKRAAMAEILCREGGRTDVPIHAGASSVLLTGCGQPSVPQYDAVQDRPHRRDWPAMTAIDFLRSTIRRRPGEITLLTIGPLTNIALLFAIDPELLTLVKQVVSMAGVFFPDRQADPFKVQREWNVFVDPIASAMVYRARAKDHLSVGLDVTLKCQLPADEVRRRFTVAPLPTVLAMAEVWFKHQKTITFHDPLAAALLFDPTLCSYETGEVIVPLDANPKLEGQSLFTPSAAGPHRVAKTVDAARFFDHYFSVFS